MLRSSIRCCCSWVSLENSWILGCTSQYRWHIYPSTWLFRCIFASLETRWRLSRFGAVSGWIQIATECRVTHEFFASFARIEASSVSIAIWREFPRNVAWSSRCWKECCHLSAQHLIEATNRQCRHSPEYGCPCRIELAQSGGSSCRRASTCWGVLC